MPKPLFIDDAWYDKLPDSRLDVYEPYLHLFFETMHERQLIWKRRFIENKPAPWTTDEIMQERKFTNVYRELDRNSQWQINNILLDDELDLRNLVWKLMVFRYFNNIPTFTFPTNRWRNGIPSIEEWDEDEFTDYIAEVRKSGINPFTSAYCTNSVVGAGYSRDYAFTKIVLPKLHSRIDELMSVVKRAKKPEEIIKFLISLPSVAMFVAHEFYQDFTYIPRYTRRKFMPFDQNDFTNVGPGASVGIRLIYPSLEKSEQKQGIYRLRDVAEGWLSRISEEKGEEMPYLRWHRGERKYYTDNEFNLTLHQIEMWLCEFSKYWKVKENILHHRVRYVPSRNELQYNMFDDEK